MTDPTSNDVNIMALTHSPLGDSETSQLPQSPTHSPHSEPDTCRICRGESTAEEPLYYPCRCCGSIKYVHQDCLMEWLSHSQKKHCELCKTPFRFTKLYSPSMPESLPIFVFLAHFTQHLLRSILFWLRAALVTSVWVFWLPYLMRSVWVFYFWVGDKGLRGSSFLSRSAPEFLNSSYTESEPSTLTCPSSSVFSSISTSSLRPPESLGISNYSFNQSFMSLVSNIRAPFTTLLAKWLWWGNMGAMEKYQSSSDNRTSSLLSDIPFLANITRYPVVNRATITMLEGQIITVAVIVSFILIILVRDYVVQQQPEINMRAAFAGRNHAAAPQVRNEEPEGLGVRAGEDTGLHPAEPHHQTIGNLETQSANYEELDVDGDVPTQANRPRSASESQNSRPHHFGFETAKFAESLRQNPSFRSGNVRINPFAAATSHHRQSNEASVQEFLDLWRQSGSSPDSFLTLVREQNLEERMASWIEITESLLRREEVHTSDIIQISPLASDLDDQLPDTSLKRLPGQYLSQKYDLGSTQVTAFQDGVSTVSDAATCRKDKGKTKLNDISHYGKQIDEESTTSPREASNQAGNPLSSNVQTELMDSVEDEKETSGLLDTYQAALSETILRPDVDNASGAESVINTLPGHLVPDYVQPEHAWERNGGLIGRIADIMFGNIQPELQDIVLQEEINADEEVDPPAEAFDHGDLAEGNEVDEEVAEDEGEAFEEWEELDGIMELIGMRGHIGGLFQNAVFCAVLVSVTIFSCIFLPYNLGRLTLWIAANPGSVLRTIFEVTTFIQDFGAMIFGASLYTALAASTRLGRLLGILASKDLLLDIMAQSSELSRKAAMRILDVVMHDIFSTTSEMQNFSYASHEALLTVKSHMTLIFTAAQSILAMIFTGTLPEHLPKAWLAAQLTFFRLGNRFSMFITSPDQWMISIRQPMPDPVLELPHSFWTSMDRFWATLCGYLTLSLLAAIYLRRGAPFSRGHATQQWEASVVDLLHQASGVLKVILVISIEMLIFPLYCGLLLDAALLPLFENATFSSRLLFTCTHPLTSAFLHWFVGTGYMFHFALFVSMCRKIMRKGVLHFIRDPDDPEFHPVRDVLERTLKVQLRKILFSAFVYGTLVIVCLGGVVWGLCWMMPGILPIHCSSNEPILEFPVDLLFYNFLMPLAVKLFKPSSSLHTMYTWWFRKCSRTLRLSWFLFGDRQIDEEGRLALGPDSTYRPLSWWRSLFLELDFEGNVMQKSWDSFFEPHQTLPVSKTSIKQVATMSNWKTSLVASGQLAKSGRFVRTPASDQVKLARGTPVFSSVDEASIDVEPSVGDMNYEVVYIPPNFRVRILSFILLIWLFAAVTGVALTISPLVIGRSLFKVAIPAHIRPNDIYAFSIGISVTGILSYALLHSRRTAIQVCNLMSSLWASRLGKHAIRQISDTCISLIKLLYASVFVLIIVPLNVAAIMELYFLIPFHTLLYPPTAQQTGHLVPDSRHTIPVIQSWTLGILYLKLGAHYIREFHADSRPAMALEAISRNGWLRPNVKFLSRAFILPSLLLGFLAICVPPAIARLMLTTGIIGRGVFDEATLAILYRASYPVALLTTLASVLCWKLVGVLNRWTLLIRDEAYLIGERLHNFGVETAGAGRSRASWKARGTRL